MVATVSGAELGLVTGSLSVLGGQGQVGAANQGTAGDQVYVNSATGNLVIQRADEILKGLGPDIGLVRTYNSLGQMTDDNGDNWRLGFSRKVYLLTGTVNSAGSSITRVAEDGAEVVFTYDATQGVYLDKKGGGAFDTLSFNSSTNLWTWTDGNSRTTETYDNLNGGRLTTVTDASGNSVSLTYNAAGLVSLISGADGEKVYIDYDTAAGKTANITQIRTVGATGATTETRVRYAYDSANRLSTVTVDLTPADNSIADGKTYVTTYSYVDATSRRIAGIVQSDGSSLAFTYELAADGSYRVKTYTDALNRTTTFTYAQTTQSVATSATANPGALTSSVTTAVIPFYTIKSGDTWAGITLAVYGVSDANAVTALQTALANPVLTAGATLTVPASLSYNIASSAAANNAVLSTTQTQAANFNLNTAALTTPAASWGTEAVLSGSSTTSATSPQIAFDQNGNGMAVWAVGANLFYSTYTKATNTWGTATALDGTLTGNPSTPNLSMSANGNALVTWVQNSNIYARRCIAGVWDGATTIPLLENATGAATSPVGSINDAGKAVVVFLQSSNCRRASNITQGCALNFTQGL
jgi:YD repeat-containing protein